MTKPGPPRLSPPDPAWPDTAHRLIEHLKSLAGGLDRSGEFVWDHIGSTSVPGLAAKPFIDLQLGVPSLDHLDGIAEALEPAGFVDVAKTRPGSPDRDSVNEVPPPEVTPAAGAFVRTGRRGPRGPA